MSSDSVSFLGGGTLVVVMVKVQRNEVISIETRSRQSLGGLGRMDGDKRSF